jgi:hypothetical protein
LFFLTIVYFKILITSVLVTYFLQPITMLFLAPMVMSFIFRALFFVCRDFDCFPSLNDSLSALLVSELSVEWLSEDDISTDTVFVL